MAASKGLDRAKGSQSIWPCDCLGIPGRIRADPPVVSQRGGWFKERERNQSVFL